MLSDAKTGSPAPPAAGDVPGPPRLRRVLGLGDLVFYGIVLIVLSRGSAALMAWF